MISVAFLDKTAVNDGYCLPELHPERKTIVKKIMTAMIVGNITGCLG